MKKYGLPEFYEERNRFRVVFKNSNSNHEMIYGQQCGAQSKKLNFETNNQLKNYYEILRDYCTTPKTAKKIREYLNIKSKRYVGEKILKPLVEARKLEYINKTSINVKNQTYKTIK